MLSIFNAQAREAGDEELSHRATGDDLARAIQDLPESVQLMFLEHQFEVNRQQHEKEMRRKMRPWMAIVLMASVAVLLVYMLIAHYIAGANGTENADLTAIANLIVTFLDYLTSVPITDQ